MAYVYNQKNIKPDKTLTDEKGFLKMELRWLLSEHNSPVNKVAIGHTHKYKGGEHRDHHHTNVEEIIYMLKGEAIERVGDEFVKLKQGDCLFIPKGVIHSHKVVSDEVETLCIYIGAPSFEKTGYVLDENDKSKS